MAAPGGKDDYKKLTGAQEAAIFMVSIGEEAASKLFAQFHEDEIREISHAISNLGNVSSEVVEKLFGEFIDTKGDSGNISGSFDTVERMLTKALGKKKLAL